MYFYKAFALVFNNFSNFHTFNSVWTRSSECGLIIVSFIILTWNCFISVFWGSDLPSSLESRFLNNRLLLWNNTSASAATAQHIQRQYMIYQTWQTKEWHELCCRKITSTEELVFAILEFCSDLNWQLVPMQLVHRKSTVRLRKDKALRELLVGRKFLSLDMMPTPLLIFDEI